MRSDRTDEFLQNISFAGKKTFPEEVNEWKHFNWWFFCLGRLERSSNRTFATSRHVPPRHKRPGKRSCRQKEDQQGVNR
jgi:hypothetical protein